ncbi:MAG: cytochrome c family protein [Planctomycetia bacterium]|nr:cytochrome c family protein [Planctomycetia bacterium]
MARSSYLPLIVASAAGAAFVMAVGAIWAQTPAGDATSQKTAPETLPIIQLEPNKSAGEDRSDGPRTPDDLRFIGVSSCAASGCHGGTKVDLSYAQTDSLWWRSAYVVWATADPHARAYQTLRGSAAASIVRKLDRLPADRPVAPYHDRRCVSCHATTYPQEDHDATVAANAQADPRAAARESARWSQATDGVSCESCHGGARKWLGEHFLLRTNPASPTSADDAQQEKHRLAELGMLDTDNLAVQAQTCVRCHVGERSGSDVRDMNHDMIAAGHPALNFEFAAYKARMPRHWSLPQEPVARADRERRSWAVGQLVSAAAALRLSAERAAANLDLQPGAAHAPWPEFSEFACFRCHHALRSGANAEPTAQQNSALARAKGSDAPLGRQLWGTWNSWHTTQSLGLKENPETAELRALLRQASNPFVAETELRELSRTMRTCATKIEAAAEALGNAPADVSREQLAQTLADVAQAAATGTLSWDEATQAYLGAVALYRAQRAVAGLPLDKADDEAGRILKQLFNALRFDQPGERRFNSPTTYDRELVQGLFEKLSASARKGA